MALPASRLAETDLETWIREAAPRLGFDLCAVAPAVLPEQDRGQYLWWLDQGFQGQMKYMERVERQDIRLLLPSVRSVICAAMVYNAPHPKSTECSDPGRGWIARYAWGEDYHLVLQERLETLLAELRAQVAAPFDAKIYVDTGPLLERAIARAAGLGWFAKNTCLIHPKLGSWFLLGEILTSLDLKPGAPLPDYCGTCTRCLDACPTGALPQPGVLDATRCISYLTIELKGAIPDPLRPAIGRHVFGCDICQDVCPWNRKAPITLLPQFQPRSQAFPAAADAGSQSLFNPPLEALAALTPEEFRAAFRDSPIKRTRYAGLLRNVAVAMGNSGEARFRPALEKLAEFPDVIVQEHARWALERISSDER